MFYMKQYIGNACGTIGLLHAVANAKDAITIEKDSFLDRFLSGKESMDADSIGHALEEDDELEEGHVEASEAGQSSAADAEDTNNHFVCFSCVDGSIYELDGRKDSPINHGPSTKETFLEDVCKVMRQFMERDPEEMRFSMVVMVGK